MRKIHKYKINLHHRDGQTVLRLSKGSKIIHAGTQKNDLFVWVEETDLKTTENHIVKVYGTGQTILNNGEKHITTLFDGPYVWHVYSINIGS